MRLQGAAEPGRTLAHTEDANTGCAAVAVAALDRVVLDRHAQPVVSVGEVDVGGSSRRVAADVGERLLQDPEGGELNRLRNPWWLLAVDLEVHVEAGVPSLLDQRADPGQVWDGLERSIRVAWLAEHSKNRAQLLESFVTCRFDRCKRDAALPGIALEQVGGDAGLHVDRGERVRDDVAQVSGDPQPFLLGTALCFLLAAALRQFEPFEQNLHVGAAVA